MTTKTELLNKARQDRIDMLMQHHIDGQPCFCDQCKKLRIECMELNKQYKGGDAQCTQ